jgi:CRISPR/Cas system CSM-associated protein Csm3 (group 7 of RAMP superfamily)
MKKPKIYDQKYFYNAEMELGSPLHIGDRRSDFIDSPIVRDGNGQPYIPATSIAGAIHSSVKRIFSVLSSGNFECKRGTDELNIGLVDFEKMWNGFNQLGSQFYFENIYPKDLVLTQIRNSTAIDQSKGAAEDGSLRSVETIQSGTKLELSMELECDTGDCIKALAAIYLIDCVINSEWFSIGAKTSSGLGRVNVVSSRCTMVDFTSKDSIRAHLENSTKPINLQDFELGPNRKSTFALNSFTFNWRAIGPIMLLDSVDEEKVDSVPHTEVIDGRRHIVIPGTSWKGSFRHQAERIANTMLEVDDTTKKDELFKYIFGKEAKESKEAQTGAKGAAVFGEVKSTFSFKSEDWEERDFLRDKNLNNNSKTPSEIKELKKSLFTSDESIENGENHSIECEVELLNSPHIAIDRFTGGVKDGALFSILEPWNTGHMWTPIEINLLPPSENGEQYTYYMAGLALLYLTLCDLHDGWFNIGYGGNDGNGRCKLIDGYSDATYETIKNKIFNGDVSFDDATKALKEVLNVQ